tara:strand:+ start:758 stop:1273 length:516 start_codon:yes stop_codon:yes gene_type:complete
MINIYLDPKEEHTNDDDICSICHDKFDNDKYKIPECNHMFHTSCIIQWYRTGNIRCPYCNSTPDILDEEFTYIGNRRMIKAKYKIISNYCRRKNANQDVKKKVEEIKKLLNKVKELTSEMKTLKNGNGSFKETKKNLTILSNKRYYTERSIITKKKELIEIVNIVPYILKK